MGTVKDYIKVIITALLTALVTIITTGFINREMKIKDSASQEDLKAVEKAAYIYADDRKKEVIDVLDERFESHNTIHEKDKERDELLIKYLDQRFTDLEKIIERNGN